MAKRIMRKAQLDRLEGFENESDAFQIELTKYWTQYEAIMKLVGTGFSGELDDKTMEAYEKRVVFRELEDYVIAGSYTHLTLPTNREVELSVVVCRV